MFEMLPGDEKDALTEGSGAELEDIADDVAESGPDPGDCEDI